jgi:hypothetical protein
MPVGLALSLRVNVDLLIGYTRKCQIGVLIFSGNYDQRLEKRSICRKICDWGDALPNAQNRNMTMTSKMGTGHLADLVLAVRPFLMAHFVHVGDEMGRNPINLLPEASEVGGNVFGSNLESSVFHQEPAARLYARTSRKRLPDGIGIHCLSVMFSDMADDILHCHWVVIGIFFDNAQNKIGLLFRGLDWWSSVRALLRSLGGICFVVPSDDALTGAKQPCDH